MSTGRTLLVRVVAAALYLAVFGAILMEMAALSGIGPFTILPFWAYQSVVVPGIVCIWLLYTDATLSDFVPGIG